MRVKLFTFVICCLWTLPTLVLADSCQTTNVSNLLGTSCTIGDVNYSFIGSSFISISFLNGVQSPGVSAASLTFTPDGSDPLNPSFSVSGITTTATGLGNQTEQAFAFYWNATVTSNLLQFGTGTNTLMGPNVPNSPNSGLVAAGNSLGDFTLAIVQTGGPNLNPSSATLNLTTIPLDGLLVEAVATDGTGGGASSSVQSLQYQYGVVGVVPTPEPSPLILCTSGLLGLLIFKKLFS
jgi:hypothetical protein